MRILITNDDGIEAPGLGVLERVARAISDDVWVVAPETDQSGLSHSLTLGDPLRLRELGNQRFALRGTPAGRDRGFEHRLFAVFDFDDDDLMTNERVYLERPDAEQIAGGRAVTG